MTCDVTVIVWLSALEGGRMRGCMREVHERATNVWLSVLKGGCMRGCMRRCMRGCMRGARAGDERVAVSARGRVHEGVHERVTNVWLSAL